MHMFSLEIAVHDCGSGVPPATEIPSSAPTIHTQTSRCSTQSDPLQLGYSLLWVVGMLGKTKQAPCPSAQYSGVQTHSISEASADATSGQPEEVLGTDSMTFLAEG